MFSFYMLLLTCHSRYVTPDMLLLKLCHICFISIIICVISVISYLTEWILQINHLFWLYCILSYLAVPFLLPFIFLFIFHYPSPISDLPSPISCFWIYLLSLDSEYIPCLIPLHTYHFNSSKKLFAYSLG